MCFEQTARERFLILQCTVQQYVVHVVVVLGICMFRLAIRTVHGPIVKVDFFLKDMDLFWKFKGPFDHSLIVTGPSIGSSLSSSGSFPSSRGCCRLLRLHLQVRVRMRRLALVEEVPVDESQHQHSDHPHGDHRLEVLQPELVLERGRPLLELSAAVLQGVCALLQGDQLGVPLQTAKG